MLCFHVQSLAIQSLPPVKGICTVGPYFPEGRPENFIISTFNTQEMTSSSQKDESVKSFSSIGSRSNEERESKKGKCVSSQESKYPFVIHLLRQNNLYGNSMLETQ
mmetsp:Transcript_19832/g.50706  ORF Transcript_19832/g.50706 Transcript_19832/m.50706 type:complete len:106 (+) Transcript_19832:677-994(+)